DARRVAVIAGLGLAEVDHPVGLELGAERDVEKTRLAAGLYLGDAVDRLADLAVGRDDPHASRPLRNEQVAVRQRLDGPRMLEAGREHRDLEVDVGLDRAGARLLGERRHLLRDVRLPSFNRLAVALALPLARRNP